MPAGAVVAIGAVAGAAIGASSSAKGRKAAIAEQDKTRALAKPYVDQGTDAVNILSDPNKLLANFQTDPGYQFRMSQGIDALNTNKAATGLLRSGSTLKDTVGFGQNLGTQEYGTYYNRLMQRAQLGLRGTGVSAGANDNASNIISGDAANQGNAGIAAVNGVTKGIGMGFGSDPNRLSTAGAPAGSSSSYATNDLPQTTFGG